MANHIDGEQAVAIGVDAADRRHGLQEIQGDVSFAEQSWSSGTPESPICSRQRRYRCPVSGTPPLNGGTP
jgi:hypothetical protein